MRRAARRGLDQHFLRSRRLAADLVRNAGLSREDLVLEIGAGSGRLTGELARAAGHVLAVDVDPVWARRLSERFARSSRVSVVAADALEVALPADPFRVVANLPFGQTTAFLRRLLDDPRVPLASEDARRRATSTRISGRRSLMRSTRTARVCADPNPLTRSSEAGKESNESVCPRPVPERAEPLTEARLAAGKVLLDAEAIGRALSRIAHEIIEGNPDLQQVALVGIHTRGVPLAHRLRRLIAERADHEVAFGTVDITFYRDDVHVRGREAPLHPQPVVRATKLDFPLQGMTCVLVDDVLYTGRTIRAAIEALFDYGRPERVQLAVLADRGHRELPIRPDYVGKNLPTARGERVQVQLVEVDEVDRIVLLSEAEEGSNDS